LVAVALARELGILGVLGAFSVAHFAGTAYLWSWLPRRSPAEGATPFADRRRLARFALPVLFSTLLGQVVLRQSETLFLGYYFPPEVAGYYGAAYGLAQRAIEFVPLALWPLALASLAAVWIGDTARLERQLERYWKLLITLALPLAVFGLVCFDRIFVWIFGDAMADGAPICRWLALVFLVSSLAQPLSMSCYVLERTGTLLRVLIASATCNIALDLLLIPRLGAIGALLAVAATFVFHASCLACVARRLVPGLRFPFGHFARVAAACSPLIIAIPLRSALGYSWVMLPAAGLLGVATLIAFRRARVFGAEEATWLGRLPLSTKWRSRLLALLCPDAP